MNLIARYARNKRGSVLCSLELLKIRFFFFDFCGEEWWASGDQGGVGQRGRKTAASGLVSIDAIDLGTNQCFVVSGTHSVYYRMLNSVDADSVSTQVRSVITPNIPRHC